MPAYCFDCSFSHHTKRFTVEPGDVQVFCHYGPPTVVINTDDEAETVWPAVDHDDWCGRYSHEPLATPAPTEEDRPPIGVVAP